MNENLITIDHWKTKKESFKLESQSKEYYQRLSFDQLISESKLLRKQIAVGKKIDNLSLQTKLIFDEIQDRMVTSIQKEEVLSFNQILH